MARFVAGPGVAALAAPATLVAELAVAAGGAAAAALPDVAAAAAAAAAVPSLLAAGLGLHSGCRAIYSATRRGTESRNCCTGIHEASEVG